MPVEMNTVPSIPTLPGLPGGGGVVRAVGVLQPLVHRPVALVGREDALAWRLRQSPSCQRLVAAPANPGIGRRACSGIVPAALFGVAPSHVTEALETLLNGRTVSQIIDGNRPTVDPLAEIAARRGLTLTTEVADKPRVSRHARR